MLLRYHTITTHTHCCTSFNDPQVLTSVPTLFFDFFWLFLVCWALLLGRR